jgi:hypothetical protein
MSELFYFAFKNRYRRGYMDKTKTQRDEKKIKKVFISPEEVETMTSIPVGSLANMRWKKEGVKFYKKGRKILYDISEVETWIREGGVLTVDSLDSRSGR